MRSQREAYQREITLEAEELREDPDAEAEELALIYRAKGLPAEEAQRVAATIMKDQDTALDTMAREELGLDPDELGSPWSAGPAAAASGRRPRLRHRQGHIGGELLTDGAAAAAAMMVSIAATLRSREPVAAETVTGWPCSRWAPR